MTRDEEARRLALSTAIAKLNAALDQIEGIAREGLPIAMQCGIGEAAVGLLRASREGGRVLEELKAKHAAETPEEDR